ncbi:MAG: hypothetical protein DRJ31_01985 [Candidatus Methanomethylicota archaeon]|uniref:DJ-1/PfpI domain-containing protein n=1 Tax=Thermoproteota archaeon TaxID=2056631 RepID=A0A497ES72_9CREN|nr:MAG: hypothetical protein DRJ31_01985 [Candidatus Verstraetearchaeota archaeon]
MQKKLLIPIVIVAIAAIAAIAYVQSQAAIDLSGKKALVVLFEGYQPKEFKPVYNKLTSLKATVKVLAANQTIDVEYDYYILEVNFTQLAKGYDALILIGGPGVYLRVMGMVEDPAVELVGQLAQAFHSEGKLVAAICAAPAILAKAGLLNGLKATCFKNQDLISTLESFGAIYVDKPVVLSDNILTSQGPNTAEQYANEIAKLLSS